MALTLPILKEFSIEGTSEKEFFDSLDYISENSECYSVDLKNSTFLAYLEETEDFYRFWQLPDRLEDEIRNAVYGVKPKVVNATKAYLYAKGGEKKDVDRFVKENLVLSESGKSYFFSDRSVPSINMLCKIGGETNNEASLYERLQELRYASNKRSTPVMLVCRKENSLRLCQYVGGKDFYYQPLSELSKFVNELKALFQPHDMNFRSYLLEQGFARCLYTFDEVGDRIANVYGVENLTPGIIIQTSDVGAASLTVYAVWLHKNGTKTFEDSKKFIHRGEMKPMERMARESHENIFPNFYALPEKLADLMAIDVIGPTCINRKQTYRDVCERILRRLKLDTSKYLGTRRTNKILDQLVALYDATQEVTAYDMAVDIMGLSAYVQGLDLPSTDILCQALGKVPFVIEECV
ncbi:MAG: hypothetical protein K6G62_00745 [Eubacterium sp.]|nr:hypothetical protein [Eubacterium sp.]